MRAWRQLGPGGLLAAVLLTVATVLAGWTVPDWLQQAQQDESQARQLRQQARRAAAAASAATPATSEPQAALPPAQQARWRVAALQALALRHGVLLAGQAQRLQRDHGDPDERLLLNTSARATYADLRAFIEAALQADPALSLDSLRLRRDDIQAVQLQAELVWSLHQRRAAAGSAS